MHCYSQCSRLVLKWLHVRLFCWLGGGTLCVHIWNRLKGLPPPHPPAFSQSDKKRNCNYLFLVVFQMLRKLVGNLVYFVFRPVNSFVHTPQNPLHYSVVFFVVSGKPGNQDCQQTKTTSNDSSPNSIHIIRLS